MDIPIKRKVKQQGNGLLANQTRTEQEPNLTRNREREEIKVMAEIRPKG